MRFALRSSPAIASAFVLAAVSSARGADAPAANGQLLVRVSRVPRAAELGATGLADFDAICRELGVTELRPLSPPREKPRANPAAFHALGLDRVLRVKLKDGVDAAAAVARFARSKDVDSADLDHIIRMAATPNDPQFPNQWALQADKLDCQDAWNVALSSKGVTIAFVDSGTDQDHQDFKSNRWINSDEINNNHKDDDKNGYVDDRFGYDFVNRDGDPTDDNSHGTMTSGICGAIGNNNTDMCGICYYCDIMTCKALDASGSGSFSDVAEATTYAVDNGAQVINFSIASTYDDATFHAALDYATSADVVLVGAAGNSGDQTVYYPAAYDNVIAVSGTDSTDSRWSSSTYGSWIDVCAPADGVMGLQLNGTVSTGSGTSYAAPFVTGLASLIRKVNPALDWLAVKLVLQNSADDINAAGYDIETGWGRINAYHALLMAESLTSAAPEVQDGHSVDLYLLRAGTPGFLYLLLPSTQGRVPGLALSDYDPADTRYLPINDDWLQDWVLTNPNNGIFNNFVDYLDANGQATANFFVPRHLWRGVDFDFSFVTIDPNDTTHIRAISNPCRIHVK